MKTPPNNHAETTLQPDNPMLQRLPSEPLNLSRNRLLREVHISACSLHSLLGSRGRTEDTIRNSFQMLFSSVHKPTFAKLVITYKPGDFYDDPALEYYQTRVAHQGRCTKETWYRLQFNVFRTICGVVVDYELILMVKSVSDNSLQELKQAVMVERARGGLPSRVEVRDIL